MTDRHDEGPQVTLELEGLERDLDRMLFRLDRLGGFSDVEGFLRQARRRIARALVVPKPTVAVVGASTDRSKYGNKAVRAFLSAGFEVYPINPSADFVEGLAAFASLDDLPVKSLDRVSLYVPPTVGIKLLDQLAKKQVKEVWLNPGAESPELVSRAEELGLNVIQACSILAVGEHPAQL